jgi:molybdopterin-containing oxidoreductase family iron-sulfur binding subunit
VDRDPRISRRVVLQLVGAGATAAGATACSRGAPEHIVPYVEQPPEVTPSVPSRYATVHTLDGYGTGVVAESHEGRPTKLEGNPRHPASLGALGPLEQASLRDLYEPSRLRALSRRGTPVAWHAFASAVSAAPPAGKETHVLLEPTSAPHLVDLVERVRRQGAVVHFDAALPRRNAYDGARRAFGKVVEPRYDLSRAAVVLALDADFLAATRTPHAWARAWASRRRVDAPGGEMSRLYVVEAALSVTGMAADERLPVQRRAVQDVAADLLSEVLALRDRRGLPARQGTSPWARVVARDLAAHPGASVVMAGDAQPPDVHVLAHALNEALGNVGSTVTYGPSPVFEAGEASHDAAALSQAIDAGRVGTLLVLGGDPVYASPRAADLARRFASIGTTAYLGARDTATARACEWTCAALHWLEAWGDALAFDGTPSIAQPLVRPLVDGRSAAQVLAWLAGMGDVASHDLVRDHWRARAPGDFDRFWRESLVSGVIATGTAATMDVAVDWTSLAAVVTRPPSAPVAFEIALLADPKVDDGRFGDNAWLQELPDPVTKLTWDNAALVSPSTAARLGIADGRVLELDVRDRKLAVPALVVPGTAEGVVALAVGYGQRVSGTPAEGIGEDAYGLRTSSATWFDEVEVRVTDETRALALSQEHSSMLDRPIVLTRTAAEYRDDPAFAKPHEEPTETLYDLHPDAPHQWGMTIDLDACTGCSACVVACMAENNVPTVGKGGVRLGRAMHWIRIDRYFSGDPRAPQALVQPMLCQHCEKAPCEYVCPVNATVHSHDGLNEMIYNRCVGTRFCSNNCPYKVRRFNFFNYNAGKAPSMALLMNPDVTVRARGVMEKCSYCVQRIREVEIVARRGQRRIADGEIATACQQTCPTGAISFGDIADPSTAVSRVRRNGRLYAVLHDLGTEPRTRYLARITNPNPELHPA